MVQLIPSLFIQKNIEGDFEWMINRPEYKKYLFIFNDDEESYKKNSFKKGGGNAVIRPFKMTNPQRAIGIPTGCLKPFKQGYKTLDSFKAIKYINISINEIKDLINTGYYENIIYSADENGNLGTNIFKVGENVKEYIVSELKRIVSEYNNSN